MSGTTLAIEEYRAYFLRLFSLLDKIYKISRHSDPSAKEKKDQFTQKYKELMRALGATLKKKYTYIEVEYYLTCVTQEEDFNGGFENFDVLFQKIKVDLSELLLEKHVMEELVIDPEKKGKSIKENKARQEATPLLKKHRQFSNASKTPPPYYNKNNLMEMLQQQGGEMKKRFQKQQQAKQELSTFLEKIRQKNPEDISQTIKYYLKNGEKDS